MLFSTYLFRFHQKVFEIFEEEIEGLRKVDIANEDRSSFHLGKARNAFTGLQVSASRDIICKMDRESPENFERRSVKAQTQQP